ncbi:hypothetical protein K378_02366 [Streptomyces sp. Amel2xB2]|uniref:hypothetical protein n=1 Tax=Streptomyces sp. Amel2xB2 TaxID=1305829 RepID=UPI000DB9FB3F|nr:hypothetical protein [Streptomyces sp. Amel2xB2]RAJ67000.1 hypothetical protein K378_02366 [Streptomyces sp. Amel2xB2]
MTVPHSALPSRPYPPPWRHVLAALTLLPRGLCALAAAGAGRGAAACRLLLRADPGPAPGTPHGPVPGAAPRTPPPGTGRTVAHAVLTVLLGALAWILAGVLLLAVARGPFYGFVDHGPYDDSWGGPGRGGAWLAHAVAATPCAVAAAGLLYGVAALHRRLTAPLRGGRRARWVLPVVLLCGAAGALFVIAWVRQLD